MWRPLHVRHCSESFTFNNSIFFTKTLRMISILQMENIREGDVSDLPGLTFKFKFNSMKSDFRNWARNHCVPEILFLKRDRTVSRT